jgi:phosphoribosylformimino-5-aminoimidazole carboxamide ribotide isomerase
VQAVGDDIPVQLGGGIRDLDTIERCLDDGVSYVIIGTAAVKNPGFLHDACGAFPGHIIVGLDARDGKVAVDGWSKMTGHDVIDLAKKYEDYGVEAIIYTDIGRDGMLSGINIEATVKLAQALLIPVIASGGLSSIDDIRQLCAVEAGRASAPPSPAAPSTMARSILPWRRRKPTRAQAMSALRLANSRRD